jgi:hypothetical protein
MNPRAELGANDWPHMGCIFPVYLLKAFLAIHLPGGNSFLALRSCMWMMSVEEIVNGAMWLVKRFPVLHSSHFCSLYRVRD